MRRFGALIALLISVTSVRATAYLDEKPARASSGLITPRTKIGNENDITPLRLRSHLEFIASDELEGRDTPSQGLDVATLYVATMLKLWGAKPAGDDGTFFQKVPLYRRSLDTGKASAEIGGKTFGFGEGIRWADRGATVSGRLVYVGHGVMVKKKGIDPYAGLDVKGKILVVATGLPKGVTYADLQGNAGEDYAWPATAAQKHGAVAVLTIPLKQSLSQWNSDGGAAITGFTPDPGSPAQGGIPSISAGPSLIREIFAGERISEDEAMAGADAPERSIELGAEKTVRLDVVEKKETRYARNVVAIVPGTDPVLKNEYVAFGAHIDHVGIMGEGNGDRIFNGADDDASGTVAILEIAHAMIADKRPKRSCLFVWHCGEEKGLWGSSYFVNHSPVDLKRIVAQLNVDMIGRSKPSGDTNPANKVLSRPDEIYVVGSTKMSSDLQEISEQVNEKFLGLSLNYKYDDPKDPESIFTRSDHYIYAQKGIPVIFYFNGVHEDYHRVSDEASKIDYDKLTNVARTIYATGLTIANAKTRPVVDKPLKN